MTPRTRASLIVLSAAAALALVVAGLLVGRAKLQDVPDSGAIMALRGWRTGAAALAGAALAVAGVLLQGLFRNVLASPSVTGCVSGATLGGVLAIVGHASVAGAGLVPGWLAPELLLPIGCLIGCAGSLAILLAITGRRGDLVMVLLVGFVIAAGLGAVTAFIVALAHHQWDLGRALVAYAQGGVTSAGPRHLLMAGPLVAAGTIAAWCWSRPLDVLLTGEDEAASLGVDVSRVRRWVLIWSSVLVSGATAIAGPVGFIGLIVPHTMRLLGGPGHRWLVPASAVGGALLAAACDVLARLAPSSVEPGLGVVTALLGAPVFAWLVVRSRREGLL